MPLNTFLLFICLVCRTHVAISSASGFSNGVLVLWCACLVLEDHINWKPWFRGVKYIKPILTSITKFTNRQYISSKGVSCVAF